MSSAEILLRTIIGPVRSDLRPLAFAVEITGELLFVQQISINDLQITKQVYRRVAKLTKSKPSTVSRRVERLAHLCWDSLERQSLVTRYLGRVPFDPPEPRMLIVFLAVYDQFSVPFFAVIGQNPRLLFPLMPGASPPAPEARNRLSPRQPMPVVQKILLPAPYGQTAFPVCPRCRVSLEREFQNFCDRCGQPLDWRQYSHAQLIFPGKSDPQPPPKRG